MWIKEYFWSKISFCFICYAGRLKLKRSEIYSTHSLSRSYISIKRFKLQHFNYKSCYAPSNIHNRINPNSEVCKNKKQVFWGCFKHFCCFYPSKIQRIVLLFNNEMSFEELKFSALLWKSDIFKIFFFIWSVNLLNTWMLSITFHSNSVFWNCEKFCKQLAANLNFSALVLLYIFQHSFYCTTRAKKIFILELVA